MSALPTAGESLPTPPQFGTGLSFASKEGHGKGGWSSRGVQPCAPLDSRACKAMSNLPSRWPKGHQSGLIVWLEEIPY